MCLPEQTVVAAEAVPTETSQAMAPPEKIVKAVPLDQLWLIHGRLYDLRNFVERHPGGENPFAGTGDAPECFVTN